MFILVNNSLLTNEISFLLKKCHEIERLSYWGRGRIRGYTCIRSRKKRIRITGAYCLRTHTTLEEGMTFFVLDNFQKQVAQACPRSQIFFSPETIILDRKVLIGSYTLSTIQIFIDFR